jgi:STE24 endopeptidase
LNEEIKKFYDWDKIKDSMRYNSAKQNLQVIKMVYMLVYDLAFQFFFIPGMIWTGLQRVAARIGMCESPGGEYYEMVFIPFFFIAIVFIDITVFVCFSWIETLSIKKSFGFSKATPTQFLIDRFMGVISLTISFVPLIIFGDFVVINFKKHIALAFFLGTFIGKSYQLWITPYINLWLEDKKVDFPEDKMELRRKIVNLAIEIGYPDPDNKIFLTESRGGDLHSNASVDSRNINISKELLQHHEGHDEEILAIVGHELGHWKQNHIYWYGLADLLYMTICGVCFQFVVDNPVLLRAFGFSQYSTFITIYLFYKCYSCSLDYPQRKLFNVMYRYGEFLADAESLKLQIGDKDEGSHPIIMALLRNFSTNLDALFVDEFYSMLEDTHPPLLTRLSALGMPVRHYQELPKAD